MALALDAAYPEACVTLIGLPQTRDIASRLHCYIDEFAEFPGFPGIPGRHCDLDAVPGFFERMKACRFDLALQMHGAGEIANPLMVFMGAQQNAGFYRPGRYCPDAERYLVWQDDEDDVSRWLRLAAHLGAAPRGTYLEFPLTPQDWAEWRALRLDRYICLVCGSQPRDLAGLRDTLAAEGWKVVVVSVAGRTSLGGIAALIAKAQLVVSSDPETELIARAVRTPSARLAADVRQTLREARELLGRAAA